MAIAQEEQFAFRDTIEPIHRELVTLLLSSDTIVGNLQAAREVMESLQVAELVDFFREDCLEVKPVQIDRVDDNAVVVYPIILPDQLAVIVSVPQGTERMGHFYKALAQPGITKAEALRQAQLTLLQSTYQHPYYWASYVLLAIGKPFAIHYHKTHYCLENHMRCVRFPQNNGALSPRFDTEREPLTNKIL